LTDTKGNSFSFIPRETDIDGSLIIDFKEKNGKPILQDEVSETFMISDYADKLFYGLCKESKWGILDGMKKIIVEPEYAFSMCLNDARVYLLSENPEAISIGKLYNFNRERPFASHDSITVFVGCPDGNTAYVEDRVFLYEEKWLKRDYSYGWSNRYRA